MSTTDEVFTDVIYQVGVTGEPPITIRPYPDMPDDFFEILTDGEAARLHWGEIRFTISRRLAAEMGRALLAASKGTA